MASSQGTQKLTINGRLNSRSRWIAMGGDQLRTCRNMEQDDDGSMRTRSPWEIQKAPNLLTVNQASLETDTTGWAAAVNCTITRSLTQALHGVASLRLAATAGGDMSATTPTGVSGRAVIAGRTYTAAAGFRADATNRTARMYIRWYNSGGGLISEISANGSSNTGFWLQFPVTGVAPVGATFAAVVVEIVGAAAAELHYVDQIMLNHGAWTLWTLPAAGIPNGGASIFWSPLTGNLRGVYVARNSGGSITIHRSESESSPDWGTGPIDTITCADLYTPFVAANGVVLYGNFGFPNDRLRFWNGTTTAEASTVAIAGRALAYHKERFWSAGPDIGADRLYYSGIADHTSWDVNNYIPVGNDGEVIEDIEPALGGLLIAKQGSIWFLTGDGPLTFVLTRLDGGEGTWGSCICSTPYGAVIAGSKDVYLWQGGAVEPISVEHPDYNAGSAWVHTAFRDDRVFIANNTGDMWVRNMASEKWSLNRTASFNPNAISVITVGGTDLDVLIGIPQEGCHEALNGVQTRDVISDNRDKDAGNLGADYNVTTGFLPLGPLGRPFTVDRVTVSVMQLQDAGTGSLLVFGGRPGAGLDSMASVASRTITPEANAGYYRYQMEGSRIPQDLFGFLALNSLAVDDADTVMWDILGVEVEYHVEEGRT